MSWTAPRTFVDQEVLTEAIFNVHWRDNLLALDQHAHSGAAGDGSSSLGNLVLTTFTDAAAPSAPGAGLTVFYTVSGRPFYRAGAGGASVQLADADDLHAQTHATAHEPGGADTMAVGASANVGSLREIGTTALKGAAGNHTHTTADQYSDHSDGNSEQTFVGTSEADISTHVRTVGATGRSWAMFSGVTQRDRATTYTYRLKFDTTTRVTRSGVTSGHENDIHSMEYLEVSPTAAPHTVRLTGEKTAGADTTCHGTTAVIEVSVA